MIGWLFGSECVYKGFTWIIVRALINELHCFNPTSWLSNTEQACWKVFFALPVCMLAIETGGCGIYIPEKSGKIFSHRFIQQSKQRLWACWAQINILFLCPRHFSSAWINTRYRLLWYRFCHLSGSNQTLHILFSRLTLLESYLNRHTWTHTCVISASDS